MPRHSRLVLPNVPLHLIQRGINKQDYFFTDDDYRFYLYWLAENAREHGCTVHAYVLMTNHVHLLISAATLESPAQLMKAQGQRYVQYVNRRYERCGTLWNGRFRSCLTQEERYLLACYRYIELNPVRAGMVRSPAQYPWSSYHSNALGKRDPVVEPHALYCALGDGAESRQRAYRSLCEQQLDTSLLKRIRSSANGNYSLGDRHFSAYVETELGHNGIPRPRGRPYK